MDYSLYKLQKVPICVLMTTSSYFIFRMVSFVPIMYIRIHMHLQIIEEMDLILSKKNVCKTAARDWAVKWTPAILRLSKTLRGKQAEVFKRNTENCEGDYVMLGEHLTKYTYVHACMWSICIYLSPHIYIT